MSSLSCPTAYLELGFLDNPADFAQFDTPAKQRAFAVAYARGVLAFLGIAWRDESSSTDGDLFRVQLGAFRQLSNAQARQREARNRGFSDAFIATTQGIHRVQVGAFREHANAERRMQEAINQGFADAFIARANGVAVVVPSAPQRRTIEQVAQEIFRGQGGWGNNPQRRERLVAYGGVAFADAVQRRVNELVG